jgi:hypothetical protein
LGYRALSVRVFNPPPEGGMSNTISQLIHPADPRVRNAPFSPLS